MSENISNMLTEKELAKKKRANTISIKTTYSQDGRSLEYVDIQKPDTDYKIFLLKYALNSSKGVKSWMEFDNNGDRIAMSEK